MNEFKDVVKIKLPDDLMKNYQNIYANVKMAEYFEFMIPLYLVSLLILCLALRPINKISLALLLENSTSDLSALENFRKYN